MTNMSDMYKIYNKSRDGKIFDFMDGPPFVTGKLHLGHLAIGSLKSTYLNFKSMMGYLCGYKLGYDCHGVPIESIANKELGIKSTSDLEKIGIDKFNAFCKETIKKFEKDWEPVYNKIGRLANFDDVYKTMDPKFMESIWWAFSELYNKGMIYRGYKVVAYSYPLQSPLSNSEESQNYKDIQTKTVYVRFKIISLENTYIVAWTTTPWTLIANLALCVNKNLDYQFVQSESGETYIVGKGKDAGIKVKEILKTVKGSELVGLKYEPIYKFYAGDSFFQIVEDDYVKESDAAGTNIVHLAPTFGEDDYRVCMQKGIVTNEIIRSLDPIDEDCKYNKIITNYHGFLVFDAESQILSDLQKMRASIKLQTINHQYPYCYRTETPLVYRACESFYINVQEIKERMIQFNKEINWYPASIGSGRFNKWLEGLRDWCISRSRYFGTPIPVWISQSGKIIVIDSVETLYKYSSIRVADLHPEIVNRIEFVHLGEKYTRVKDVFDCWFESGCVPFAQHHYPFQNKEYIDSKEVLSDFIVEGVDQTRGWFYTLLVLSTALFNKKPAKNIMAVGLVLGENGKKISKKDGNFVDPDVLIDKYTSDSIRLYLLQSPLSYAEPFSFKEADLIELKQLLYGFKNASDFLLEHTHNMDVNLVKFDRNAYRNTTNSMDKWILINISKISHEVIILMNSYEVALSVRKIISLIEDIRNWYLKFNRDRLKGKCGNADWICSTSVLNWAIINFIKLLAPFAPFISQEINISLRKLNEPDSGHENCEIKHILEKEYTFEVFPEHESYIKTFDLLQRISRLVRSARVGVKTHTSSKTPIKSCIIYTDSNDDARRISETIDLIQAELNVIDISYEELSMNISYRIIPDMKILGKKHRGLIKKIQSELNVIQVFDKVRKDLDITINGEPIRILTDEYTLEPVFSENDFFDGDIMVKIDFTYDKEIEDKFNLKKFIAQIQQTRKEMGLHVWDKISIEIEFDELDIIKSDNVIYMRERLECDVNPKSQNRADRFYENGVKRIGFSILKLF